jgi:pimeloyl-ACP methyl ester carboxylesterase
VTDRAVHSLEVDRATLAYTVSGSGPGLLVPWCNFDWNDTTYVDTLAASFTVVVAAPRGYAKSTWLDDGSYHAAQLFEDLLAVCDAVGLDRFSLFGYSLTAAVSVRLAAASDRVDAVVAGGFPWCADLSKLQADVRARTDVPDEARERELSVQLGFDVRAARAFYDDLSHLPPGALVDDVSRPLFTFWGSDDEVIDGFEGIGHLEAALRDRGIGYRVMPGPDHAATLLSLDGLLPELTAWLLAATGSRPG